MTIEKNIWADIQDGVTQGLAAAELVNDNKRAVNEVIDVVNGLGTSSTSNVVQVTGDSTTDVMSQKAVTDVIGDAVLRQELASPDGAKYVGFNSKTLAKQLSQPNAWLQDYSTSTAVRSVSGVVGGALVGVSNSGSISLSVDGNSWTQIYSFSALPFSINPPLSSVHELPDGEVLVNTSKEFWRSSGWPGAGATWTKVLTAATYPTGQARFHQGWGVRVSGNYVFASEYGSPKPIAHQAYLSTDGGFTFASVFDQRDLPEFTAGADAHLHGCCIDPWHSPLPRLWVHSSDAAFLKGWYYSDDLGSTWTRMANENYRTLTNGPTNPPTNDVVIDATPSGMVIGSDSRPDGTAVIPRDASYATAPYIVTAYHCDDRINNMITYVGQSQAVDGDWVYTLLNPEGGVVSGGISQVPPRIVATSSAIRQGFVVWEGEQDMISLRRITIFDGALYVNDETNLQIIKLPLYQTNFVNSMNIKASDTGDVLGGQKRYGVEEMAVHPFARAQGLYSVAIGAFSSANETGQLVLAPHTVVEGSRQIVIKQGAPAVDGGHVKGTAEGVGNSISIGAKPALDNFASSVAIGDGLSGGGLFNVIIGASSSINSLTSSSVAIGRGVLIDSTECVAIGRNATTQNGAALIAIGKGAQALGSSSMAVGRDANASHANSVALGWGAATTANGQVNVGARYLQMGARADAPLSPPTGEVAIYYNGTTGELSCKFPSGRVKVLAVDAP